MKQLKDISNGIWWSCLMKKTIQKISWDYLSFQIYTSMRFFLSKAESLVPKWQGTRKETAILSNDLGLIDDNFFKLMLLVPLNGIIPELVPRYVRYGTYPRYRSVVIFICRRCAHRLVWPPQDHQFQWSFLYPLIKILFKYRTGIYPRNKSN